MMDRASWEFTDLRSRMNMLESRDELDANDILRPHVLARIVTSSWLGAPLGFDAWRLLQTVIHEELSLFAEEAYHETNRFLLQRHVLPEVDLRPVHPPLRSTAAACRRRAGAPAASARRPACRRAARPSSSPRPRRGGERSSEVGEETRLMTRAAGLARGTDQAEAVLGRLNRLVGRQLPDFADHLARPGAAVAAPQRGDRRGPGGRGAPPGRRHVARCAAAAPAVNTPALLEELHQRKQALKQAAATPVERATIEIVALLFQSILMEDAIPATVRVWFARLQMPVLRVAVSEPDFFATVEHPARRLIDRMGSCVMGFDSTSRAVGDLLEKEIKRVVQVVEAYPDTGRRVFQTVLTEFEKFLEHYFKNENEASKKGVSLAPQVEQRETMAIQYTIELRKMLNDVPVQEGVREFLFQVWADVLATAAVKSGNRATRPRR